MLHAVYVLILAKCNKIIWCHGDLNYLTNGLSKSS